VSNRCRRQQYAECLRLPRRTLLASVLATFDMRRDSDVLVGTASQLTATYSLLSLTSIIMGIARKESQRS